MYYFYEIDYAHYCIQLFENISKITQNGKFIQNSKSYYPFVLEKLPTLQD